MVMKLKHHPLNHFAPSWAEWFAIDDNGAAYYYERHPIYSHSRGVWMKIYVKGTIGKAGRHLFIGYADESPINRGEASLQRANHLRHN